MMLAASIMKQKVPALLHSNEREQRTPARTQTP
jgi:hypothetical protein